MRPGVEYKNQGATLSFNNLSSVGTGKLMLTMIAAINEFERQNLLERQREGIAIAKKAGKYKGGQVKKIDDSLFTAAYDENMGMSMEEHKELKRRYAEYLSCVEKLKNLDSFYKYKKNKD